MKKSVIVLAISAALGIAATAQAETTLYGSARVSVDYTDPDNAQKTANNWDVVNNLSRLGVQGSEDLGGGLKAIYQYEFEVDVTEGTNGFTGGNRPKWVGLESDRFGALTLGTQYTPYYDVIGVNDYFISAKTFGSDIYLYPGANPRQDNSVLYKTPEYAGFGIEAMGVANGDMNNDNPQDGNGLDIWNVMARYKNGPLFAGVTYVSFESPLVVNPDVRQRGQTNLFGAGLSYQIGDFTLIGTYEDGDASLAYGDARAYLGTATYTIGDNVLAASYGYVDSSELNKDVQYYVAGVQHLFSKRTKVWVEYIGRSAPDSIADPAVNGDLSAVSVGIQHDF